MSLTENDHGRYLRVLLAVSLAVSASVLILGTLLQEAASPGPLALSWLSIIPLHIAGPAAALLSIRRLFGRGLVVQALQLQRPEPARLHPRRLISQFVAVYLICGFVAALTLVLFNHFGIEPTGSPVEEILKLDRPLLWVSMGVIAVVLAPLAEELLFRGVLFEALAPSGAGLAAVVTSAAFSLIHAVPEQAPALFLLALFLQWSRRAYGSLWVPIAFHAAYNATSLILIYAVMQIEHTIRV